MLPAGQPAADVAAAGDGREIVEVLQQLLFGQFLDGAKGKGGATDAAAGNAESRERLFFGVDLPEQSSRIERAAVTGIGTEPAEFVGKNRAKRQHRVLRHGRTMRLQRGEVKGGDSGRNVGTGRGSGPVQEGLEAGHEGRRPALHLVYFSSATIPPPPFFSLRAAFTFFVSSAFCIQLSAVLMAASYSSLLSSR